MDPGALQSAESPAGQQEQRAHDTNNAQTNNKLTIKPPPARVYKLHTHNNALTTPPFASRVAQQLLRRNINPYLPIPPETDIGPPDPRCGVLFLVSPAGFFHICCP